MDTLASALDSAFDEEIGKPEAASTTPEAPAAEPVEAKSEPEAPAAVEAKPPAPVETPQEEEPTGDVLLDKLTPEELAAVKQDPKLRKIYAGLMKSYTPKMQALAEQQKLWDALNNPDTRAQAVESLARAVGLEIKPPDQPQRDKAAEVADSISEEWSKVVGPEAAQMLRPLIEKTALAAVQSKIEPLERSAEASQEEAWTCDSRKAIGSLRRTTSLARREVWDIAVFMP